MTIDDAWLAFRSIRVRWIALEDTLEKVVFVGGCPLHFRRERMPNWMWRVVWLSDGGPVNMGEW